MDKFQINATLANRYFEESEWQKCIQHLRKSGPHRAELEEMEAVASYHLAKRLCSERNLHEAKAHLGTVLRLSVHMPKNIRRFAEARLEAIKRSPPAIADDQCPVCREDPLVQHPEFFEPEEFQPEVESAYCIAAYRSGYDRQRANPFSKAIRMAKNSKDVCRRLGDLLGHCLVFHADPTFCALPDLIVPVPSSPDRYAARGYSIAEELALGVSGATRIPSFPGAVRITRATQDLRNLSASARAYELRGAFSVADIELLENVTALIVDDVVTHGTTLREMARTLSAGGAQRVLAAAVAHTESSWWL